MKNIHILPTDKPSRLFDDGIEFYLGELKDRKGHPVTSYNIYITSNEEIKEGDCFIHSSHGTTTLLKCKSTNSKEIIDNEGKVCWLEYSKKIILTTDQDLIKDGVQAIDDEFLEWFVKNPSCEEVEVIPLRKSSGWYDEKEIWHWDFLAYKIIIPKEEVNHSIKKEYVDDQDAYGYDVIVKEKSKKETLSNPIIIVRNDDKEEFIHLSNGMYRTKWGILNNSVSTIPLEAFDKSKFTFYYE